MSTPSPRPFEQFAENISYARAIVDGAAQLADAAARTSDRAGADRAADLCRAAWLQAVAALDHWVHEELYDRALTIAHTPPGGGRSNQYQKLEIPLNLVEQLHHNLRQLRPLLREALEERFGYQSFQSIHHIGLAFAFVLGTGMSVKDLWRNTARQLGMDKATMEARHGDVIKRRNQISHTSDLDRSTHRRREITVADAAVAVDWIESFATALRSALPAGT